MHLDPAESLSGKPLGELVTNRQRAGFDAHPGWIEEMRMRDLVMKTKKQKGMLGRPVAGPHRSLSQTGNVAILDAQVPRL